MSDVRALPYGPRHTGPGFGIFLRARTSQNVARKADTPRHTGPTYFYTCHVLPNYTFKFYYLAAPNLVYITAVTYS